MKKTSQMPHVRWAAIIGIAILFLRQSALAQWTIDSTYGNVYLSNSGNNVLIGNGAYNPNFLNYKLEVRGSIRSSSSVRATTFLDDDNISFYLNPSGMSVLSDVRASIFYDRDDITFYTDPSSISSLNDVRARIFYDRDNTSYFLNPAGESRLSDVRTSILYDLDNTGFYLDLNNTSLLNEVRGSIIYDRDNSSFYVDPAATSNLQTVTIGSLSLSTLNLSGNLAGGSIINNSEIHTINGIRFGPYFTTGFSPSRIYENPSAGADGRGEFHLAARSGDDYNDGYSLYLSGGSSTDGLAGNVTINSGTSGAGPGSVFLNTHNAGNVGIGYTSTTNLQTKLDVNGSIRASSFITLSDGLLKDNIKTIGGALETIRALRGVSYKFRNNKTRSLPAGTQTGFIAQEVEQVIPDAVITDADGVKGVDYNKIIPILVEAVKEQASQIEALKRQIIGLQQGTIANNVVASANILHQSTPNPTGGSATIGYKLSDNSHAAFLLVYDLQGKQIKRIALDPTKESVEIQGGELQPGVYLYLLLVNGVEIDTKRLIVTD
jgi:hypothetical protein